MAGPEVITYGSGTVKLYPRASGTWSVCWRESGTARSTTRSSLEGAREFARAKARAIDTRSGAVWIRPAQADALAALQRIVGPHGNTHSVLADLEISRQILGDAGSLETAARYYMDHGPGRLQRISLDAAVARFLAEYADGPSVTRRPLRSMLSRFLVDHPGLLLLDLTPELLQRSVTSGSPAPRTVFNRINNWRTFLNRCREWELLPAGRPHAAERLRRPRRPDAGRAILSLDQAAALLALVRSQRPQLLPYLILGGWLGLRSSECQRVEWPAFDWSESTLHLSVHVAQKLLQERYLPVPAAVAAVLRPLCVAAGGRGRCCLWRSQEYLSRLARDSGTLAEWPGNVLRHSWFSYSLAASGHIHQLAEWGGNSAKVIRSNYRRPIPQRDGLAWLALLDPDADPDAKAPG